MSDQQAVVEVHDHHILVRIPQFTVFGNITAVARLTVEQCFDIERQLAEARAKVLSRQMAQELINNDQGHLVVANSASFGSDGVKFYSFGCELTEGNQPGQVKIESIWPMPHIPLECAEKPEVMKTENPGVYVKELTADQMTGDFIYIGESLPNMPKECVQEQPKPETWRDRAKREPML